MAPSHPKTPYTEGSSSFDPESTFTEDIQSADSVVQQCLKINGLWPAITYLFSLLSEDSYVYHATASVTLEQVQKAILMGGANGMHDWYPSTATSSGDKTPPLGGSSNRPEARDIDAYISLFDPTKNAANTLRGFSSNAKKGSIRASVANWLSEKRHLDASIVIPKRKKQHFANPYFDFWAWSCRNLEWCGPDVNTATAVKTSHHVLPVFMHHFGCVVPSYEAVEIIRHIVTSSIISSSSSSIGEGKTKNQKKKGKNENQKKKNKTILDIGCGNGYWTFLLRRAGLDVIGVDNAQSRYRTCWIGDIIYEEGGSFLRKRTKSSGGEGNKAIGKDDDNDDSNNNHNNNDVLLLVYPITANRFTESMVTEFKGDVICIVGTQNGNGYTGFRDVVVDHWMAEHRPEMELLARVPLPSFAGKDDALFVWRRRKEGEEDDKEEELKEGEE